MVMSRSECWLVAESLGLNKASFDAALDFFHKVSLMFYFRDILPEVVFIDPQVILDKVSELIEFMFELQAPADKDKPSQDTAARNQTSDEDKKQRETPEPSSDSSNQSSESSSDAASSTLEEPSPKKASSSSARPDEEILPPGWREFKLFGRITREFLKDSRFSSHYHREMFTCDDLIHLLEELLVFGKQSTEEEESETWFMPSVLSHIPAAEMKTKCVSICPLVVDFPDGGPQNGVFCSLMSHVLSGANRDPCPWKLCECSKKPACLYRDCIQFEVPKFPGAVTLVDRYEYFEVHVYTSKPKEKELWKHTRNAIFSGLDSVSETLGYSNNKPHPAILCPAHTDTDKPHPAFIQDEEWICTSDSRVFGNLKDIEVHWKQASCMFSYTNCGGT